MTDLPPPSGATEVQLVADGVVARGRLEDSRVVVLAGSRGRTREAPSFPETLRRRRQELLSSGHLRLDGDDLVVEEDCAFDSPSTAAAVLRGIHVNGWKDWRLADGTPIDQLRDSPLDVREQAFRRRWYEAHLRRLEADLDGIAEADRWQGIFTASSDEAISILAELERSHDASAFVAALQQWAVKPTTAGFNGFSGQMMLNQLLKRTENETELADVLIDVLRVPGDLDDARRKLDRIVAHIESIRVGAHPAPGHSPFLLSYFWSLQDEAAWPTIWASAAAFTEYCTGQPLPSVPSDRYVAFVEVVGEMDSDFHRFIGVASWFEKAKPVILDQVLVDRCKFGLPRSVPAEALRNNADALVAVAAYLATELADDVSASASRTLSQSKPGRFWAGDRGRSDLWASWRAVDDGPSIRLWLTHAGLFIGVTPGLYRPGWIEEVGAAIEAHPLPGFERFDTRGSSDDPDTAIVGGRSGEFIYARRYEPEQLAALDVRAETTSIAAALQPLLDRLVAMATGDSAGSSDDPLASNVERFQNEQPRTNADDEANADRRRFAEMLAPDRIALTDIAELRQIWNTGRYGSPGVMPGLNRTIRDADAAEYDRIIDAFRYLCWGDDPDAVRIDRLLDDPEYKVSGLGESVILKMLAICHPEKFVPVYPFSGPKGKRVMLAALGMPEPSGTRGEMQVASNDAIRARLEPFFPNDPWRMMVFLYWFIEGGADIESEGDDVDVLDALAEELLVDRSFLDDIVSLLEDKGQVIFYGPPGTGKTYLARRLAEALASDPTRRSLVQFHPSTSYEDFFEGYRPEDTDDGAMSYRLTRGPLALIAQRAAGAPGKRHLMVIDELNRANLPRVFGELLFLLEYRNESVRTLYRPEDAFELSSNLWFIGTMNTADRSIALVDAALRRRFHFIPFFPNYGPMKGLLERWLEREGEPLWVGELVAKVNDQLAKDLGGPHLQIGPSYFMKSGLDRDSVRRIWEYNIEPFIEDQFFGDPQKMDTYRFEQVLDSYLHDDVGIDTLEALEAARSGEEIVPVDVDVDEGADIDGA
jgi:5-methylcytosine-specific restriction protein B